MEHSCCSAGCPSNVLVWRARDTKMPFSHFKKNTKSIFECITTLNIWLNAAMGSSKDPQLGVSDCRIGSVARWRVFISLFIDSLAFLWVFEINNSQQKSDRGMKISTFPAVKPFIKLTRGRIGREVGGGWRLARERKGSRCRGGGGGALLDTGVKGKEAMLVWEEEESCAGWQRRIIQEHTTRTHASRHCHDSLKIGTFHLYLWLTKDDWLGCSFLPLPQQQFSPMLHPLFQQSTRGPLPSHTQSQAD